MFEYLRSLAGPLYPLCVAFMIIIVMTLLASVYAALRADKVWAAIKRQYDLHGLKKEIKANYRVFEPRD